LSIAFGSINTGLPKDIVKQIISAEQIPIQKMEERKGKIQEKQKLVNQMTDLMQKVKDNLAKNSSAQSLKELKVDTNNEMIGVTFDKNVADVGNYQLEVVQLAQKSSAMTSGFADKDESYVGVGFIQYSLPSGDTKEIYVDSDNASLTGIAKLINADTASGMRATVVNDGSGSDTPWRLIVSVPETGDASKAEFPSMYFIDGEQDLYIEFERAARDAKIKVDGFEIEVPENKVKDVIPGVTIDLKKAKPGEEFSLQVGDDKQAVTGKIGDLVESLNEVLKFIHTQNSIDEKTDTSKTLGGDMILQTIESRIRSEIFKDSLTEAGYRRLGDIGITFQRDGMLALDQKKFEAALSENYKVVSQVLTGYNTPEGGRHPGFVERFGKMVEDSLRSPDGVLSSRKRSIQTNIEQIDRRIDQRQRIIEQKERNLKDKFARLEETMSRIKSQGAGVAALGSAADVNPVQQLG
jgi:flagellar hook-associated protein 2